MSFETRGNKIILCCMNNPQKKLLKIQKNVSLIYTTGMPQRAVLGTDAYPTAVISMITLFIHMLIMTKRRGEYVGAILYHVYQYHVYRFYTVFKVSDNPYRRGTCFCPPK